ncbi:Uncharacterized protein TCM_024142 [Theobroma cacao]|uniref:Reverse transcriptase zinc-binding domain-containing protein n=1 Tax=Theobroma cacao TaxID=3641 RepID=A0A061EWR0_THECC|nr:Uncharacterized protein TCM_024142 [Theobroma cacao]
MLMSTPYYVMQTAMLPIKTCKIIEAHCKAFLWGGTVNVRKFKPNIIWALGNRVSTRFWTDQLLDDILQVDTTKSISVEIVDKGSVKEYVTSEGEWDLDRVCGSRQQDMETNLEVVWSERIRTFLFLYSHKKILTHQERVCKNFAIDPRCPTCQVNEESILHCLRECLAAATVWFKLLPQNHQDCMIGWQPLATNFITLNVDGVSRSFLNRAAAGGV